MRKKNGAAQRDAAIRLVSDAGLDGVEQFGEAEIIAFQNAIPTVQIKVISADFGDSIVYRGPENNNVIHIYHHDNHFDLITSMTAFMGTSYWCEVCEIAYSNRHQHRCKTACKFCQEKGCIAGEKIKCLDCRLDYQSQQCFDNHKKTTSVQPSNSKHRRITSRCERIRRCVQCGRVYNTYQKHECGKPDFAKPAECMLRKSVIFVTCRF